MTSNSHRSRARAAQKQSGESYMRARRRVDNRGGAPADTDDAAATLTALGFPASGSPTDAIAHQWNTRSLPAGTGEPVQRGPLLRVPIGTTAAGEPLWLDLKDAAGGNGPHALVAGAAGAGKTSLLQAITFALRISHCPQTLATVLIDASGKDAFDAFGDHPATTIAADLADVDDAFDARAAALRSADVRSLTEYQALRASAAGADLPSIPYLVVVIDATDRLGFRDRDRLERVRRLGRSLGVHALASVQQPADPDDLSNSPARIALKAVSPSSSRAVIDTDDAFHLPPTPGAGIFAASIHPHVRTPFQAHRVSRQAIRDAAAPLHAVWHSYRLNTYLNDREAAEGVADDYVGSGDYLNEDLCGPTDGE